MKTVRNRSTLTVLVALTLLFTVTSILAHRSARVRSAAASRQSVALLPASAYGELLNGLAAGGR
jgi:hypothetical protein